MRGSTNTCVVDLADGRQGFYSYKTLVAGLVPGRGYIVRDQYYSMTTSRHVNSYAGKGAPRVAREEFAALMAPLEVR